MNLEMGTQLLGAVGEAPGIFLRCRTLAEAALNRGILHYRNKHHAAAITDLQQALQSAKSSDLLVIDTPGQIVDATTEIARQSHLIVQPTSPSSDDLHLSVLVFLAMERVGIPRDRLAFALCGVLSANEERDARSHLASFGYEVLEGSIPEHLAYREAMRVGRSITETRQKTLDGRAARLMADLLQKAMTNAGRKKRGTRG